MPPRNVATRSDPEVTLERDDQKDHLLGMSTVICFVWFVYVKRPLENRSRQHRSMYVSLHILEVRSADVHTMEIKSADEMINQCYVICFPRL